MGVGYEQARREATIVGVIGDVRYLAAGDSSQPEVDYSYRQFGGRLPVSTVTLVVRAAEDPSTLARPVRTAVRDADQRLVAESWYFVRRW